jgi:hypothetical protein
MELYQGVEVGGLWVHVVISRLLVFGGIIWALFDDLFYVVAFLDKKKCSYFS